MPPVRVPAAPRTGIPEEQDSSDFPLSESVPRAERRFTELPLDHIDALSLFPAELGSSSVDPSIAAAGLPDHAIGGTTAVAPDGRRLRTTAASVEIPRDANSDATEPRRGDVQRLEERVSALDARIRKLSEPDQPLARADALLDRLEERGAMTAEKLEHVSRTTAKLEEEIERLHAVV